VLTNVEYIALKMQSNPGQSGRYYRGEAFKYRYPDWFRRRTEKGERPVSDHYSQYFRPSCYMVGLYWADSAPKDSTAKIWLGTKPKPSKSRWDLTRVGWAIANEARKKLGLSTVPWEDAPQAVRVH
jgi:hypothetical protein